MYNLMCIISARTPLVLVRIRHQCEGNEKKKKMLQVTILLSLLISFSNLDTENSAFHMADKFYLSKSKHHETGRLSKRPSHTKFSINLKKSQFITPSSYVVFLPCRIQLNELNSTEIRRLPNFCRTFDSSCLTIRHKFHTDSNVAFLPCRI